MTPAEFKQLLIANQGQLQTIMAEIREEQQLPVQDVAPASVDSVAIRLPNFWMAEPEIWFMQVEANFENRHPKITVDYTKFTHVLQALPQEVLSDCQHALLAGGDDRYGTLKAALIKAYGKSRAKKNAELLALNSKSGMLGDRKPSTFLMKIRKLSDSSYEAMERAMFLHHMPLPVRTALASSKATSNDELAAEADAVLEEFQLGRDANAVPHAVAAVTTLPPLAYAPQEVSAAFRPRGQDRARQPPIARPSSEPLCFLHRKYGVYAHSCRSASCPMKNQITPPAQGNGRAGR